MYRIVERAKTRYPTVAAAAAAAGKTNAQPQRVPICIYTIVQPQPEKEGEDDAHTFPFLLVWVAFTPSGMLSFPSLQIHTLHTAPDHAVTQLAAAFPDMSAAAAAANTPLVFEPKGFVGVPEAGRGVCVYFVEAVTDAPLWKWLPPRAQKKSGKGVWALASEIVNNEAVGPWPVHPQVVRWFQLAPQFALLEKENGKSGGIARHYPLPDVLYTAAVTLPSVRAIERCFVLGMHLDTDEKKSNLFTDVAKEGEGEGECGDTWGRFAAFDDNLSDTFQLCLGTLSHTEIQR